MGLVQYLIGKKEAKPVRNKKRYSCPFYGFYGGRGIFVDTKGNQCGLITESYSPCKMEMNNQTPNWDKCSHFNNESNREVIKRIDERVSQVTVFPEEFRPKGKKSWNGISLKEWIKYVMKRGYLTV